MTATDIVPRDGNLPEMTVSELAGAIRRTVEDAFGFVRLRGEISGFRGQHGSGHCYFSLKDEGARIDAVIWRSTFQRLKFRPEEGLEVIATGRVTTYPGKSTYQIVIDRLEPAGVGALMALLEERRRRLAAEGLFDEARKKPLPWLPRVIGVVTSPTGAVIRDILHRIADRFPTRVVVWPVRVQGETSAREVAAAIRGFNALEAGGPVQRPDLLIVARGGGSLEDLWSFNDEEVVRAAAASAIPLISAVGHETDWTLIDHAADRRASTPTAAAEFAVPVRVDLAALLGEHGNRQLRALRRLVGERRARLAAAARALPRREALLDIQRQSLDRLADGLRRWREGALRRCGERLVALAARISLRAVERRISQERARLSGLGQRGRLALRRTASEPRQRLDRAAPRLPRATRALIRARRSRLDAIAKLAASLGHRSVLARGYALVRDGAGRLVRDTRGAREAGNVRIDFHDGTVGARVSGAAPKRHGGGAADDAEGGAKGGQGTLL